MNRFVLVLALVLCLQGFATEDIHFMDIGVVPDDKELVVTVAPETLFTHARVRDERYFLGSGVYEAVLDAPFRQSVFFLRNVERNRATLFKKKKNHDIISFQLELTLRKDTGEEVEKIRYKTVAGLAEEPGMGFISCKEANFLKVFPLATLAGNEEYKQFLKDMVFPFKEKRIALPKGDSFSLDLYYRWPDIGGLAGNKAVTLQSLTPKDLIWEYDEEKKPKRHLGSTYTYRSKDTWRHARSQYFKNLRQVVELWSRVLAAYDEGDYEEGLVFLEEYVREMPGDKNGLMLLRNLYMEEGKDEALLDMLRRFKPLYAAIPQSLEVLEDLESYERVRRNRLLGRRSSFAKNGAASVEITSPTNGDLVSGSSFLTFKVSNQTAPVLNASCYIDQEFIGDLSKPPFKIRFNTGHLQANRQLRVVVYYEDETYSESSISIKTIRVDNEDSVRVVPVQATVFQRGKSRDLTVDDFKVRENGTKLKTAWLYKNDAPLRVVVLLDTSLSMNGSKLHKTQYAIKTFLSKLAPDDLVSVYAFDNKVMRLVDFTNDFEKTAPNLMTLSPHGTTSLYDAMLIAEDALSGQNGTKVMIVISDGEDSTSSSTDIQVAKTLKSSEAMVYSIGLPEEDPTNLLGNRFLAEMSRTSGCVFTKLESLNHLDQTFQRIYEDLRNLYYLGYYSETKPEDRRDVDVKVGGAQVRFRILDDTQTK